MVGRCIPYWNGPFLGDMLVFWGVFYNSEVALILMLIINVFDLASSQDSSQHQDFLY